MIRNSLLAGAALVVSSFLPLGAAQAVTLSANSPSSFTVDYNGNVNQTPINGLSALATFNFTGTTAGAGTTAYNFTYSLTNDSSVDSRVSALGFEVNPSNLNVSLSSAATSGVFDDVNMGNFPNQVNFVNACIINNNGNSCSGGGSGGVDDGATGGGLFSFVFNTANLASIDLLNFAVRYQSIVGVTAGTSGTGTGMVVVPGPIAGAGLPALMALGGFVWARRRKAAAVA